MMKTFGLAGQRRLLLAVWLVVAIGFLACLAVGWPVVAQVDSASAGTSAKTYIEQAMAIQSREENSPLAIPLYEKAIEAADPEKDDYELLFAHYAIMKIHAVHDLARAVEYAHKCQALIEPIVRAGAIMHFTPRGKFYEEVIRFSANAIAWHAYEQNADKDKLNEMLELLDGATGYVEGPQHFYLLDTKVRILLKLGQDDKAYRIVRTSLIADRQFAEFDDIAASAEYKAWRKVFEAGETVVFSEAEKAFLGKAKRLTESIRERIKGKRENAVPVEIMPPREIVPGKLAIKKYRMGMEFPSEGYYLVFEGDLHIKGPLNRKWVNQQAAQVSPEGPVYGVVVTGDLVIDGDLIDDGHIYLHVGGKLMADYVFSYNGYQSIVGEVIIGFGIYGEYNDGFLDVFQSKLHTPYLIASDHGMPRQTGAGEFIYLEAEDGTDRNSLRVGDKPGSRWDLGWDYFDDSQKLLAPTVWNDADEFSVDRFFEIVRKGENPFHELDRKP
jgi:hypothetical protein